MSNNKRKRIAPQRLTNLPATKRGKQTSYDSTVAQSLVGEQEKENEKMIRKLEKMFEGVSKPPPNAELIDGDEMLQERLNKLKDSDLSSSKCNKCLKVMHELKENMKQQQKLEERIRKMLGLD